LHLEDPVIGDRRSERSVDHAARTVGATSAPAVTRTTQTAVWAWLTLVVPLWIALNLCTYWEPVVFDGWGNLAWYRWNRLDGSLLWGLLEFGWTTANPRLGQTVTTLLYAPGPWHVIVTPLLELATFWLMTAVALARWPSCRRAGDALAFSTVVAVVAACTPQLGPMLFYRPFTGNYVFGLAVNLAWLVPYRFHVAGPTARGGWHEVWRAPAMLLLGAAAGMCNEHTGVAFAALGALAIANDLRKRARPRPWMIGGLVGLVAGYTTLLLAPANDVRYGGLAKKVGLLARLRARGVVGNLLVPGRVPVYLAWSLPWILLAVVIAVRRKRAGLPPASVAPATDSRALVAIASAGVLAACALLASPLIGARLYFASVALAGLAIAAAVLARLDTVRSRTACALLSGLFLGYMEIRSIVTYAKVGPTAAARVEQILQAPTGSRVVVPRLPVARSNWFLGDDLVSPQVRATVAARFHLGAVDLAP
jgi:hypothetical protein